MLAFLDNSQLKADIQKLEIVSAMERFKDPDRIRGERITATIQLPQDLKGYHKLKIYADTPDKKELWFSIPVKDLEKKRKATVLYGRGKGAGRLCPFKGLDHC